MNFLQRLLSKVPGQKTGVADMRIEPEKLAVLRPDDQFLVSYPRSGNTWSRYLVSDLLVLSRPDLAPPDKRGQFVPDIHRDPLDSPLNERYGLTQRIIKSHNIRSLMGWRIVYIFRRPADSLISYYHFHLRYEDLRAKVAAGAEQFCRSMIDGWCDHVELALQARETHPDRVHFVAYEALVSQPMETLRKMAAFLKLPHDDAILAGAIERNEFSRLRSSEETKAFNKEEFFFRKGRVGSADEELSADALAYLEKKGASLYARAEAAAALA